MSRASLKLNGWNLELETKFEDIIFQSSGYIQRFRFDISISINQFKPYN